MQSATTNQKCWPRASKKSGTRAKERWRACLYKIRDIGLRPLKACSGAATKSETPAKSQWRANWLAPGAGERLPTYPSHFIAPKRSSWLKCAVLGFGLVEHGFVAIWQFEWLIVSNAARRESDQTEFHRQEERNWNSSSCLYKMEFCACQCFKGRPGRPKFFHIFLIIFEGLPCSK